MSRFRWHWPTPRPDLEGNLARECGIHPVVARILLARGLDSAHRMKAFLREQGDDETDPFLLKDMEPAVSRLLQAIRRREHICVYGDYDVDGQASTALLVGFLRSLGAKVSYYVPRRLAEGYGLHASALAELRRSGVDVVVTADCGVTAVEAAETAAALGIDLIITDHHQVPAQLPRAVAVINPWRPDCPYPYKSLAGVGVSYKLALAVWRACGCPPQACPEAYLDLVALGTVADVMPLTGENRWLVRRGLNCLNEAPRVGVRMLMETAALDGPVHAGHLGFILGPRLNAGGRLHDALTGVRLLLTTAETEARELAAELDRLNRVRQSLEEFILEQARRQLEKVDVERTAALVVAGEGWHPGVLGIVASRLVEQTYRPVLVIGTDKELARGSGRSIPGFDLHAALSGCADLFTAFGGHAQAAGFSLASAAVPQLRERFAARAQRELGVSLAAGELIPELRLDAEVGLDELDEVLAAEIEELGPFGAGNPTPLLGHRRLRVTSVRAVGSEGAHLQMTLQEPERQAELRAIGFGMGDLSPQLRVGMWVQAAFSLQVDEWQGRREVKLRLKAVEPARAERIVVVSGAKGAAERAGDEIAASRAGEAPAGVVWVAEDRREGMPAYRESLVQRALLAEELADLRGAAVLVVLTGEERDEVLRVVPQGRVRVVVLAGSGGWPHVPLSEGALVDSGAAEKGQAGEDSAGALQVVLACVPPEPGMFAPLAEAVARAGGLHLHLLYGAADVRRTERLVHLHYPGRDELAGYYRTWRRMLAGGEGFIPPEARTPVTAIFSELGLLRREGQGWRLIPPPQGQKLDLERSPTYVHAQEVRAAFARWAATALHGDPERVGQLLFQGEQRGEKQYAGADAAHRS